MSNLPLFTSDIKQEVQIRLGKGTAALEPKTVMKVFDETVAKNGPNPALHQKRIEPGKKAQDTPWTTWTWEEYRENVNAFGKALLSLGFERFDSVNILGFNSPEWLFANFGAIAAGGVSAGIYTTNAPDACKYISKHSKAKVVVVEGIAQLEKYFEISNDLPDLKAIVVYGLVGQPLPADVQSKCAATVSVYKFEDFVDLGKKISDADLKARSDAWKAGEACSLIYTSGTTGPPKAVMVTNDNFTWTVQTMDLAMRKGKMDNSDVMISYLPLSHVAAQMLDMHSPMKSGCQVYFAQPDALKGSLGATLKDVRPTTFFGVPRVWEKFYEKMQEVAKASKGLKKSLATWAKTKQVKYWEGQQYGHKACTPPFFCLSKKIIHKVHVALGFDRCYSFYCGAAPLEEHVYNYFLSINIPIMDIYGMSESTGPISVQTHKAFKFYTCGRPIVGTEIKTAEHSELCFRGRHVFAGYMGMPDKTKETIDTDGWLHTGDVAHIDDDNDDRNLGTSGFVKITGRIKELIVTAGGENVPPVLIEEHLKEAMPALANCMVIGDKRKFLSAVMCLHVEIDEDGVPSNKLTGSALDVGKDIGSEATTTDEARECPKWKEYIDAGVKAANQKATSRAQNIAKWSLLSTDFSEKGGELTPTLKLKRSVTHEKYSAVIEKMYA